MRRLLGLLGFIVVTAAGAQQSGPCAMLSASTLAQLSGIADMQPVTHGASAGGHSSCAYYWPHAPAAQGRDGSNPGAQLVVDLWHFPTVQAAKAKVEARGTHVVSTLATDSPLDQDELGDLENLLNVGGEQYFVISGSAARHGTTVAIVGMSDGFSANPALIAQLQATALTLAGAHVVPIPRVDVCSRISAASLQPLVSLHASSIMIADRPGTKDTSSCIWRVEAEDAAPDEPTFVTVTVQQYLNPQGAATVLGDHTGLKPGPPTNDPTDKSVSHRGATPGAMATHGNILATVTLSDASADAVKDPGYPYHLKQIALAAAGATLTADPSAPPLPKIVPYTFLQKLQRPAVDAFKEYFWVVVVGIFPLLSLIRWYRRRWLRQNGLPGKGVIHSVSDTGITVNNSPRVRMQMTITPQNGDPYEATTTTNISRLTQGSLIGHRVNVLIDPRNRNRFVIVP